MPNKCMFVGRINGRVIEKKTSRGEAMSYFKLACKTGFGDSVETDYIECVAFGDKAKIILQYAEAGMRVYIEGVLKTYKKDIADSRKYEARYNIRITEFYILSSKAEMRCYRNADALDAKMLLGQQNETTFTRYKPRKPTEKKPAPVKEEFPEEEVYEEGIEDIEDIDAIDDIGIDDEGFPPIPF